MEPQLVISNVSEKYGHVSSLGVGASLFVFISAALDHFSLSYYAFVLVAARHYAVELFLPLRCREYILFYVLNPKKCC